jgi:hypothetical protein
VQPVGVVAGGDEQFGGDVVADAVRAEQSRRSAVDEQTYHRGELIQHVVE